jgi:hypothetical protein
MKERVKFVLEWERRWNEAQGSFVDMAELCRKFGVRPTGYAWVKRFRAADPPNRARSRMAAGWQTHQYAPGSRCNQGRRRLPRSEW